LITYNEIKKKEEEEEQKAIEIKDKEETNTKNEALKKKYGGYGAIAGIVYAVLAFVKEKDSDDFTIGGFFLGVILISVIGYFVGVKIAKNKIKKNGL
jgi:hypothetical protein